MAGPFESLVCTAMSAAAPEEQATEAPASPVSLEVDGPQEEVPVPMAASEVRVRVGVAVSWGGQSPSGRLSAG